MINNNNLEKTPLMKLMERKFEYSLVSFLIYKKTDVNLSTKNGETYLHLLSKKEKKHKNFVSMFSYMNQKTINKSCTALHSYIENNKKINPKILNLFFSKLPQNLITSLQYDRNDALYLYCKKCHLEVEILKSFMKHNFEMKNDGSDSDYLFTSCFNDSFNSSVLDYFVSLGANFENNPNCLRKLINLPHLESSFFEKFIQLKADPNYEKNDLTWRCGNKKKKNSCFFLKF